MRNETARREIEALDYYLQNHTNDYSEESHMAMMMAIKALEQEPSANPQKIGHWKADVDRWGDIVTTVNGYRCDKCNTFNADKDNYCPHCGAKMVEPQESEDKK